MATKKPKPRRYKVIGRRRVGGVKPGGTWTDDGVTNVRALLKSGHLAPLATGGEPGDNSRGDEGGDA